MSDLSEQKSVAIMVAPNGGRKVKSDHPAVPLTPQELAQTARESLDAGAAMIHIHIRNADGSHLLDADGYIQAIAAVKQAVGKDLVIQMTSEALGLYRPEQQAAVIRAVKPEAVSLALREFVPNASYEGDFGDLLAWIKAEHILPQIILYSSQDAEQLDDLRARGIIPDQDYPVLYVLGRYTTSQISQPNDLLPFLADTQPKFSHWSVCAFGRYEAACVTNAALLGGHIRVGFENNTLLPDGSVAANNAALVKAVRTPLEALGYELQNAETLRTVWHKLMM